MEFIYIGIGILVALLCVTFYRQGVKDGRNIRNDKPLEKVMVTKSKEQEPDKIREELENIINFQPQYVEVKHE